MPSKVRSARPSVNVSPAGSLALLALPRLVHAQSETGRDGAVRAALETLDQ